MSNLEYSKEEILEICNYPEGMCEPYGSRVTCSPPPEDTDEDWCVFVGDSLYDVFTNLLHVGFERCGDYIVPEEVKEVVFVALRRGTLNLVVTNSEDFFNKTILARDVCKKLNLMNKDDRITVHWAIRYGTLYDVDLIGESNE